MTSLSLSLCSPPVLVIPYMAMLGCGAPVPGSSALVEDPQTQELVQTSRLLLQKVMMAIPETHRSSVQSEVRQESV